MNELTHLLTYSNLVAAKQEWCKCMLWSS